MGSGCDVIKPSASALGVVVTVTVLCLWGMWATNAPRSFCVSVRSSFNATAVVGGLNIAVLPWGPAPLFRPCVFIFVMESSTCQGAVPTMFVFKIFF